MSDNYVTIVPVDPQLVPAEESVVGLEALVRTLAPALEGMERQVHPGVRFFDAGANFESVACPHCRQTLDLGWWSETCDHDLVDGAFLLAERALPCCAGKATLNDLVYDWPQAFGRFGLRIMNPSRAAFSEEEVGLIQGALGCKVRIVYQHL